MGARGLHEVAKVLSKGSAHLCVLATNCDEPNIIKLIEALCAEQKISLLKVDDKMKLGQWAGLCKLDQDGNPRKVVKCSCVAVTNSVLLARLSRSSTTTSRASK